MGGDRKRATIGDYFTLQRGKTYESRLLGQPGPILLGLATIDRNGGFRADSLQTYGGETPEKLLVWPGDLYVSLKDVTQSADLLGAVARLPMGQRPGRLTQDTVRLEPKDADAPVDYLYWLLRTPQYRDYCRAHATGTTTLGLARDDFLSFPAQEPTPRQRRLVDTLTKLEEKIELNHRMSETLESMARALFRSWFVDFDPVRAKAEWRETGLPEETAALFPNELVGSEWGPIPRGWKVTPLERLVALTRGTTYQGKLKGGPGPVLLGLSSIRRNGGFREDSLSTYGGDSPSEILLGPGDIFVSLKDVTQSADLLGAVARVPRHIASGRLTQDTVKLSVLEKSASSEVLYQSLLTDEYREYCRAHATGTTNLGLARSDFLAYPIVQAPHAITARFDAIVRQLRERSDTADSERLVLESLRARLLPAIVSGNLRGGEDH